MLGTAPAVQAGDSYSRHTGACATRSEAVARHYLLAKGYLLLGENYTTRRGEIDLIVQAGSTVVFVEVRQRRQLRFGTPAESIDARKRARLRLTALHFLVRRYGSDDLPVRFDAVMVTGTRHRHRIEHLEGIDISC